MPAAAVKSAPASAVPSAVAHATLEENAEGLASVTVKVAAVEPASPSATCTSSIDAAGTASSSVTVPIPCASAIEAL